MTAALREYRFRTRLGEFASYERIIRRGPGITSRSMWGRLSRSKLGGPSRASLRLTKARNGGAESGERLALVPFHCEPHATNDDRSRPERSSCRPGAA